MATNRNSVRFTISDVMNATRASESATRRYLQAYETSHPSVRMRSENGTWSLDRRTFERLSNRITARRAELGVG